MSLEDDRDDTQQGRWSSEEHKLFLEGINRFGREWDKVQAIVRTRSLAQIRSHAQKYFLKLSKNEELERLTDAEYWKLSGRSYHEQYSAMVVLDLMSGILHQMKKRRKVLLDENPSLSQNQIGDTTNDKETKEHEESSSVPRPSTEKDSESNPENHESQETARTSAVSSLLSMGMFSQPAIVDSYSIKLEANQEDQKTSKEESPVKKDNALANDCAEDLQSNQSTITSQESRLTNTEILTNTVI